MSEGIKKLLKENLTYDETFGVYVHDGAHIDENTAVEFVEKYSLKKLKEFLEFLPTSLKF